MGAAAIRRVQGAIDTTAEAVMLGPGTAAPIPDIAAAPLALRPARADDAGPVRALVRAERLNPNDLDWRRFIVAEDGGRIVGAVQVRAHADGARELSSLVVAPAYRGRGLAGRLVRARLATEAGPVYMVTGTAFADHFAAFGFRTTQPADSPRSVRLNYRIGSAVCFVLHLPRRQKKRLALYLRAAMQPVAPPQGT
jgi:amino-acid N-acetyltransferase